MENLLIKCLVNNGINKLFKFFNEVMIIVVMINLYGYESFLNKKNKGFCFFIVIFCFYIYIWFCLIL